MRYKFNEIANVPKHVELKMSEVAANFDSFDFSIVKGNILHTIYDVEIENAIDAKISMANTPLLCTDFFFANE